MYDSKLIIRLAKLKPDFTWHIRELTVVVSSSLTQTAEQTMKTAKKFAEKDELVSTFSIEKVPQVFFRAARDFKVEFDSFDLFDFQFGPKFTEEFKKGETLNMYVYPARNIYGYIVTKKGSVILEKDPCEDYSYYGGETPKENLEAYIVDGEDEIVVPLPF